MKGEQLNSFIEWREGHIRSKHFVLLLSFFVGCFSACAAVILKSFIHLIQYFVENHLIAGGHTWWYLITPMIGITLAALFVRYVVRDDISHGITKILYAISQRKSIIKAHNMWSSVVGSGLTIGFGGSVGAEAPIVLTGAAIGSNLAKAFRLDQKTMMLMIGCGAAGAIGGIFKAPIAGLVFTLEVLMMDITMTSVAPLLISSVTATAISYIATGTDPMFPLDQYDAFSVSRIPWYLILGVVCGFASLYFTRGMNRLEQFMKRHVRSIGVKILVGGLMLSILVFLFPPLYGEGYDDVGLLLNGQADGAVWFFALILFLKVFAMTFTNAGGGVGGTFGPTLFVGAIAGYVLSSSLNLFLPGQVPVPNFVLVGMAGLMAGVMQAPLTAIFLIAEISGGYELLMPLILTSAIAYGTTRIFEKYSIYTKRIAQTGELLTHDSDQAVLTLLRTESLVETDFTPVRVDDTLGALVEAVAVSRRNVFPVLDGKKRFQGYVDLSDIRRDMFRTDLYDTARVYNYLRSAPEFVYPDEPMDSVMRKFGKTGAWNLPVVDRDLKYVGFLSRSKIFNAYREELRDFSQD